MENQEKTNQLAEERTLLAAERTFSAWLRTALAAMAGGLAILRLQDYPIGISRYCGSAGDYVCFICMGYVTVR